MFNAIVPIVFMLAGGAIYVFTPNTAPKFAELGKITFAAGVFALAFSLASKVLAI